MKNENIVKLRNEAGERMTHWLGVSNDEDKMEVLGKTKCNCLVLASYFEGLEDAYNTVLKDKK